MKRVIIAVVGQTTTGKSDLAVELARKFNGEVISADSRQIYQGFDLASGKITKEEMAGIAHHMLNVSPISQVYSVAQYCTQARIIIEEIFSRGKIAIICGGTGLYFDALLKNFDFDDIEPNQKLRDFFESRTAQENIEDLLAQNPDAKKSIDLSNPRRVERALEKIYQAKMKPIISTSAPTLTPDPDLASASVLPLASTPAPVSQKPLYDKVIWIGLKREPDALRKAIAERLEKRLSVGMIEEIENAIKDGTPNQRLEQLGLEFRYISRYLIGQITYEEMRETLVLKIRQYAKRQLTWFKRNQKIFWLDPNKDDIVSKSIERCEAEFRTEFRTN